MPKPEVQFLNATDDDPKVLARVVGYYHETLKKTQVALDYLKDRGLTNPALTDRFRLGFCDRTLGLKLPPKALKDGETVRTRLQRLGLLRTSGHEQFRGSVTVPIPAADGSGRVVDIFGQKIGHGLRPTAEVHTHLNGDRLGVFNVEAFGAVEEVVLCTSVFDALTFWSNGFRNVTTMFGVDALTTDLLGAFEEFNVKRVLTTSEKVVEKLLAAGLETFLIRLPADIDVNAYALQTGDPADALGSLIRGAEWAGKGPPVAPVPVTPAAEAGADVTLADLLDADDVDDLDALDELDDVDGVGAELELAPTPAPEPPIRTASPVPPVPPQDEAAVTENEVVLTFGIRRYRVRGLSKNATPDVLKVNILVSNGVGMHVDSIDLYSAKHRTGFVEQVAAELNVEPATVKHDLGRVLLKLEEVQDARFRQAKQVKPSHPELGRHLTEGGRGIGLNPYPVAENSAPNKVKPPESPPDLPWYELIGKGFANVPKEIYYMARDTLHTGGTFGVVVANWAGLTDKVYLPELKSSLLKGYEDAHRRGDKVAAGEMQFRAMLGVFTIGASEPIWNGVQWGRGKATREEFYESVGGFGFGIATLGVSRGLGRVGRVAPDAPLVPKGTPKGVPKPGVRDWGFAAKSVAKDLAGIGFDLTFPFVRDVGGAGLRGAGAGFRWTGMKLGASVRERFNTGNGGLDTNRLSRLVHNKDGTHRTGVRAWAARQVAEWTGTRVCFVAGTPIQWQHGAKAIEEFRSYEEHGDACDLIVSRSEHDEDGHLMLRRVLRKFVRTGLVLNLALEGGIIIGTTGEHPFWVRGKGWTPAQELKPGDELRLMAPGWVRVESVEHTGRIETVYNLEIEDDHTYFVGCDEWGFAVWAHNADCLPDGTTKAEFVKRARNRSGMSRAEAEAAFAEEVRAQYGRIVQAGRDANQIAKWLADAAEKQLDISPAQFTVGVEAVLRPDGQVTHVIGANGRAMPAQVQAALRAIESLIADTDGQVLRGILRIEVEGQVVSHNVVVRLGGAKLHAEMNILNGTPLVEGRSLAMASGKAYHCVDCFMDMVAHSRHPFPVSASPQPYIATRGNITRLRGTNELVQRMFETMEKYGVSFDGIQRPSILVPTDG